MLKLYELVQAGSPVDFMPRVQDGRIVYYDGQTLISGQARSDRAKGSKRNAEYTQGERARFSDYKPPKNKLNSWGKKRCLMFSGEDERGKIDELDAFLKKENKRLI